MAAAEIVDAMPADVIEAARARMREKFGGDIGKKIGGKGTARRKVKKVHKTSAGEGKKLHQTVKKLGASDIPGIEEVQFYTSDGNVMSFRNPSVQGAPAANTYVISGNHTVTKDDSAPSADAINALLQKVKDDPEFLKKACEDPEVRRELLAVQNAAGGKDDEIPDLVENFDQAAEN